MPVIATPTADAPNCGQPQLPGTTSPSPLPVSCYNQHIIVPRTPAEPTTGRPILTRTFAVEVKGAQQATIEYVMRDVHGNPVDLRDCLCIATDDSSESLPESESGDSLACPCPYKLVFRLNEYLSGYSGCEFPVQFLDPANGKVAVELQPKDTRCPGIYFGEFALIECAPDPEAAKNRDSVVVFSNKIYVIIGRNLWNNRMNGTGPAGPPSISEVRLHLRDTDPSESFLLDNLAFSDEEIAQATYLPVQYWNEIPPPIGLHTTTSFPYRYHWLMAIAGYLFLAAAEQQRRNNLAYAAGGVQVNDQNKEPNYEQAAHRRLEEFKTFVRRKKAEINLENAYGVVGSPYYRM